MVGKKLWILVLLGEHIIDNFSDVQTPAGSKIFGQKMAQESYNFQSIKIYIADR